MKKKLTLAFLFIIFIPTALFLTSPSLVINKERNLGNVTLNSKKEFEITITNLSRKSFEIAKVYTSCGCTKAIGEISFNIKRGETINVMFEFDPSSMHQKGDYVNHEVYFLVTDPIEKEYKVKITGNII